LEKKEIVEKFRHRIGVNQGFEVEHGREIQRVKQCQKALKI